MKKIKIHFQKELFIAEFIMLFIIMFFLWIKLVYGDTVCDFFMQISIIFIALFSKKTLEIFNSSKSKSRLKNTKKRKH